MTIMNWVERTAIYGALINLYQVALQGKEGTSKLRRQEFQRMLAGLEVRVLFRSTIREPDCLLGIYSWRNLIS
jgi:hypothetical protein